MLKSKNLVPRSRLLVANSVIVFVFTILLLRFFHIQIYGYNEYKKRADINRIRAMPTAAPRGMILDRYGQILVDNYPTYILTGLPNEMGNENWSFSVISNCTAIDTAILIDYFDRWEKRLQKNLDTYCNKPDHDYPLYVKQLTNPCQGKYQ